MSVYPFSADVPFQNVIAPLLVFEDAPQSEKCYLENKKNHWRRLSIRFQIRSVTVVNTRKRSNGRVHAVLRPGAAGLKGIVYPIKLPFAQRGVDALSVTAGTGHGRHSVFAGWGPYQNINERDRDCIFPLSEQNDWENRWDLFEEWDWHNVRNPEQLIRLQLGFEKKTKAIFKLRVLSLASDGKNLYRKQTCMAMSKGLEAKGFGNANLVTPKIELINENYVLLLLQFCSEGKKILTTHRSMVHGHGKQSLFLLKLSYGNCCNNLFEYTSCVINHCASAEKWKIPLGLHCSHLRPVLIFIHWFLYTIGWMKVLLILLF